MDFGRLKRSAIAKVVLVGFAAIFFLFACYHGQEVDPDSARPSDHGRVEVEGGPHFLEARQREGYLASKHGLQFGVPKHAFAKALTQTRARQRLLASNAKAGVAGVPAVSSTWNFIGPMPMSEKANYTGSAVGSNMPMTGRLTSVAADATGLIVTGAASGGLWISTNNGTSFVSVFDNEPTEAIGAIALDTTTSPSTIYVGTGEGNNSVDSLYGAGLFKSSDLGQNWTSLGPSGTFDRGAFTSLAIDTTTTPGTPRIFAGVTNGFSANRADAGIFETDSSMAGLWFSSDGGNSWSQYSETTFQGCDLIGDGTAPCPADDVKVDPLNPQNVYVAIDTSTVYSSSDGGQTFNPAPFVGQGRDSLAIGPKVGAPKGPATPTGGAVYAMLGAADGSEFADL